MTGAVAAGIFAKGDVEAPMQPVFDGPMAAYHLRQVFGVRWQRAEEVALLCCDVVVRLAHCFHHDHAL